MFPEHRPRRLRRTAALRRLVAETRLDVDDLVAPLFVKEGITEPEPVVSMPGVVQHTQESLRKEVRGLAALGVPAVILFGVPAAKDAAGSGADATDGVVQMAIRNLKDEVGDDLVVMADACLDEYTDHGHCGLLTPTGEVDNDATLERYASIAVAQADAGVDVVAPSGMMDGQVGAIRTALDATSHADTAILAYSAKYASSLYGPFRDAAECAPQFGDRHGYQMQAANAREALDETALDAAEGADMIMVKPALAYLDVIASLRSAFDLPLAAYHVSGEYAMVMAAAANGWIDGDAVAREHLLAIRRAGADFVLTYFARAVAESSREPDTRLTDEALLARARARIPGGVNSPVRAFDAVGGAPFFVAGARGAELIDTEGTRYIDYVQSWGASILGHADRRIVDAVRRAALEGTSYGAPTEREVELAEAIAARVPSVEKVRLVSSGTEAAMTAVRLARGATGRATIVKFAGCYHGHLDALLVAAGSGVATLGLPGSAGVTPGAVADTVVVPYNDEAALDEAFAEHQVAAVLVEPIAANMGLVPPAPGFLSSLRHRCALAGTLLVFDEVITGFRVGIGGEQVRQGITPDLSIFGKVVGGGLPLAAVGGSAAVMDELAPLGPVYQAGTLSGNPLATAAGLAALDALDADSYVALEAKAGLLLDGLRRVFDDARIPAVVTRAATLGGLFFAPSPVTDYASAQLADHARYAAFFHGMLDRGVYFAPSGYETMFVSLAHTDEIIGRTVDIAAEVATTL